MEWHIDYYQKENGEIPVLEFLISLPPKLRAKTQSTIDLLEACGTNLQAPYVAPVKGDKYKGLWELRVKQASDITRVFYFTFKEPLNKSLRETVHWTVSLPGLFPPVVVKALST